MTSSHATLHKRDIMFHVQLHRSSKMNGVPCIHILKHLSACTLNKDVTAQSTHQNHVSSSAVFGQASDKPSGKCIT